MRLADSLTDQPDVFAVAIGNRPPYVDPTGRYRQVVIIERSDFGAPASQALVNELRRILVPAARFPPSARAYVGGAAAQGADFLSRTYGPYLGDLHCGGRGLPGAGGCACARPCSLWSLCPSTP